MLSDNQDICGETLQWPTHPRRILILGHYPLGREGWPMSLDKVSSHQRTLPRSLFRDGNEILNLPLLCITQINIWPKKLQTPNWKALKCKPVLVRIYRNCSILEVWLPFEVWLPLMTCWMCILRTLLSGWSFLFRIYANCGAIAVIASTTYMTVVNTLPSSPLRWRW